MRLVVAETHGQAADAALSLPALRRYRLRAGDEALGPGVRRAPGLPRARRRPSQRWTGRARRARPGPATPGSRREDLTYRRPWRAPAARGRPGPPHPGTARVGGARVRADPARVGDRVVPPRRVRRAADPRRRGPPARRRPRAPRAGGTRPPGSQKASCGRPSWGSTSSATSTAAGGSWRTTSARPAASPTPSPSARCMDDVMPDLPRPAGTRPPGRRLRAPALDPAGARGARDPRRTALQRPCLRRPGSSTAGWPTARASRWSCPRTSSSPTGWWSTATAGDSHRRPLPPTGRRAGRPAPTTPAGRSAPRSWTSRPTVGSSWPTRPGTGSPTTSRPIRFLPELITYYLGERPVIESVPDLPARRRGRAPRRPGARRGAGDQAGRRLRRGRRADRTRGHGGRGRAPAAPRSQRDPAGWVAQEVVALSSLPSLTAGQLEPRRVDLRAFVYLTGPARRGLPAGTPGPDPGRPGGQPDRQQLAGRRGQGHLDRDRADRRRAMTCADSQVRCASTERRATWPRCSG